MTPMPSSPCQSQSQKDTPIFHNKLHLTKLTLKDNEKQLVRDFVLVQRHHKQLLTSSKHCSSWGSQDAAAETKWHWHQSFQSSSANSWWPVHLLTPSCTEHANPE